MKKLMVIAVVAMVLSCLAMPALATAPVFGMLGQATVLGGGPLTNFSLTIPGGYDPIVEKYYNAAYAAVPVVGYDARTPFVAGEHQATFAAVIDKRGNLWEELGATPDTKRFERVIKVWSAPNETMGFITLNIDVMNSAGFIWNITVCKPDGRPMNQHTVYPDDGIYGGRYSVTVPVVKGTIRNAYTIYVSAEMPKRHR